jgi:hypothetical protein
VEIGELQSSLGKVNRILCQKNKKQKTKTKTKTKNQPGVPVHSYSEGGGRRVVV